MKESQKLGFEIGIIVAIGFTLLFFFSKLIFPINRVSQEQITCAQTYGYHPMNLIPAYCLKYFLK